MAGAKPPGGSAAQCREGGIDSGPVPMAAQHGQGAGGRSGGGGAQLSSGSGQNSDQTRSGQTGIDPRNRPGQTGSDRIRPDQTESDRIRPSPGPRHATARHRRLSRAAQQPSQSSIFLFRLLSSGFSGSEIPKVLKASRQKRPGLSRDWSTHQCEARPHRRAPRGARRSKHATPGAPRPPRRAHRTTPITPGPERAGTAAQEPQRNRRGTAEEPHRNRTGTSLQARAIWLSHAQQVAMRGSAVGPVTGKQTLTHRKLVGQDGML